MYGAYSSFRPYSPTFAAARLIAVNTTFGNVLDKVGVFNVLHTAIDMYSSPNPADEALARLPITHWSDADLERHFKNTASRQGARDLIATTDWFLERKQRRIRGVEGQIRSDYRRHNRREQKRQEMNRSQRRSEGRGSHSDNRAAEYRGERPRIAQRSEELRNVPRNRRPAHHHDHQSHHDRDARDYRDARDSRDYRRDDHRDGRDDRRGGREEEYEDEYTDEEYEDEEDEVSIAEEAIMRDMVNLLDMMKIICKKVGVTLGEEMYVSECARLLGEMEEEEEGSQGGQGAQVGQTQGAPGKGGQGGQGGNAATGAPPAYTGA